MCLAWLICFMFLMRLMCLMHLCTLEAGDGPLCFVFDVIHVFDWGGKNDFPMWYVIGVIVVFQVFGYWVCSWYKKSPCGMCLMWLMCLMYLGTLEAGDGPLCFVLDVIMFLIEEGKMISQCDMCLVWLLCFRYFGTLLQLQMAHPVLCVWCH